MSDSPRIIELPQFVDSRGQLSVVESMHGIPFRISRTYWISHVPQGARRGCHAHKSLYQLIVAVSGSLHVTLDDGRQKQDYQLSAPDRGLLVMPGTWIVLDRFSHGAACLVLASEQYDADDYIHDYQEFLAFKGLV